jgi:predicted phage tail protein
MKEIFLHGILAKEFGSEFKIQIPKPKDCIKALDANLNNFINRINDLASQGFHYTIIVDNKKIQDIQELEIQNNFIRIDLVPLIVGSGAIVGGIILTGVASLGGAASAAAMTVFLGTGVGSMVATLVGGLVLTAVTMGLQMLMQDKNKNTVNAAKSTTTAVKESFDFSNKANVANQGSSIPIGYGRLKVGSQVIQYTVKAFQSQIPFDDIAKKFNEDTTSVISTKTTAAAAAVNIGSITVTVTESTAYGNKVYKFAWTTSGITELRNAGPNGVKLNLSSPGESFTVFSPKKPTKTFWLKYPGGSRTFSVNAVGKFTG